ncbi:MAG: ABC transporter substrate-binding protein [Isosphaeraceae bacterium]
MMLSKRRMGGRLMTLAAAIAVGLGVAGGALAADPVKLGFIMPTKVLIGKQALQAATVAQEMINAEGGILGGRKVELVVYDDSFNPVEGVAAAQRLINQDGVKFIVGTVNSSVGLALVPLAQSMGIVYVAVIPKHTDITKSGSERIFRLNSTTLKDGAANNTYLNAQNPQTFAYLGENSDFGRQMLDVFKATFKDRPTEIVYSGFFDQRQSDFNSLATSAKASGADTLCINGGQVEQYANVIRSVSELGYKPRNLCLTPGLLLGAVIDLAGKTAEGIFSADIYLPSFESPVNKKFVEVYKAKHNTAPEKTEALAFEGVWIVAKAIDKAGAVDPDKVAKIMRETTWNVPRGAVTFGKDGQALSDTFIVKVQDGRIVRVN